MELYSKKLQSAVNALTTLQEALDAEFTVFVRDSAIQRFEYKPKQYGNAFNHI